MEMINEMTSKIINNPFLQNWSQSDRNFNKELK